MKTAPFYAGGLRFSCQRCSTCCRHEPGFVFLSRADLGLLAKELELEYTKVVKLYCRWIPAPGGEEQLSLREKPGFDCIFWRQGCGVYKSRPLQCRTFPFWESNLASIRAWKDLPCPGAGRGELHSREYIEECLAQRQAEPLITRRI
ncbi:MAG: YkgJ family cysteine cluster protein [Spirochaetaceae bacterium]|jgi:Fe-S-cluster containining protein|nr:YkgJ family cysteine cluster protein [Spirochaetaceae bacterium]